MTDEDEKEDASDHEEWSAMIQHKHNKNNQSEPRALR